jgi:ribosomal protein S18 acetylase RimI-like enzyme
VGAVRVLSDGHLFATVPEILVDPGYRRRGIGRELMRRALAASPGRLFFGAQPESLGFFRRLGAEPGPTGLVLSTRDSVS